MSQSHLAKTDNGIEINVLAWVMTTNGWEYYITEMPDKDGIGYAYVQGFENEFGTFSMDEIKPYMKLYKTADTFSTNVNDTNYIAPPEGGYWLDNA